MLSNIYFRYKVNLREFFKSLSKVLITAFSTGSATVVMLNNFNVTVQKFKVSENFCSFWIPLSHILCKPTKAAGLAIGAIYAASVSENLISTATLVMMLFLALQLSFASAV